MNMGRALPLPPIVPPTEKSSSGGGGGAIGVVPTRTEQFQSETGRAIDNLVTSSPLFYTTGSAPSLSSKYHEQLGSPNILKPNFRDLTGCTRLTTSLSQPKRSFRALQSLRQESDNKKPITMGKSSQQASCSSRNRERERILPPVPIRVNAKIRQIYSQITPSTTIPPPALISQMTQTETEYFLIPTTSTISTSRTTERQMRQADQEALSSSGSNNNNICTADACTSPINTPGSRKASAYSLPPLSFTPNYISKLEDLEKITGHIIIQRFFTRTDDAFGSWIEKQLSLTNKTVGVDTTDFEEFDCSNNYRKTSLSEDEKSENLSNEAEALLVEEITSNINDYVSKGICSPIQELPGEILSAEENNIIEQEEEEIIGEEHEKHDPLQCLVDDCVQCECFKSEYDSTVIDPRSSTPINKLDPVEEDIISQCVVLELKRALEKDSQELEALAPDQEAIEDLAETTIGSETLANDEEEIAVESLIDAEEKDEECVATTIENGSNENPTVENVEISNDKEEEEITTKQENENTEDEDKITENLEENTENDSSGKIIEKEDIIVGSEQVAEEIENSEQIIDAEGNGDEILEADVSKSKVVDYLTELGDLPRNDEEIFETEMTGNSKNAAVDGETSQIFAGVQLTEVEEAGESVERDGESLVPRLKRSTSIDSCLGTESSGETRTILNDSGSSRLGDSGRFEHELVCWPSISDMVVPAHLNTPRMKSLEEIIQENCPAIVGTINIVNGGESCWEDDENQQQEITIIHSCTSEIGKSMNENMSSSSGEGPRSHQDRDSESDRGTETESDVNSENYHARSEAESSLLQDDDEDGVENDDDRPSQEDQFESMISSHVNKGKYIRGVKKNTSTQTGKSMDSSRSTTASTTSSFDLEVVSKSKRFTTCTTQLSSGHSDYVVADRRRSYLPSGTSSLNLLNMKFSVGKEFESEVSICVPAKSHGGNDGKSFVARKTEKSHSQNIPSSRDVGLSSRQREKVSQAELTTLWKDVKTRMDNKVALGRDSGKGNSGELQIVGNGLRVTDSLGTLAVANPQDALMSSEGNNDKIKRSLQRLKKILDN